MMNEWGTPTFYLQSQVYEFAEMLKARGKRVPDLAMAGGFSSEDGVFKAIAMGAPDVKAVCMGRGLMIPGMVGKNIAKWIEEDDRTYRWEPWVSTVTARRPGPDCSS